MGTADAWQADSGPIAGFLEDRAVTEVMVNGPDRVFVERAGVIEKTTARFADTEALLRLMRGMVAAVGKTLSTESPCADGRLEGGFRIHCVVPPIAVDGPALTIRKASAGLLTIPDLVRIGSLDERLATFLKACVLARMSIIVAGGAGTGKTTFLNAIGTLVPSGQRVVTIEDTAELRLPHENTVRLESRPATGTDRGITTRELVINALRMRPDRILLGECRGPEAFDLLVAMNTGHEGSMATIHANSARDALRRLETMILMAGMDMPIKVIRQNISSAVHLVVHTQRGVDGSRRIGEVLEVGGMEGDVLLAQDVFHYSPVRGFESTATVPACVERFKARGVPFAADFFREAAAAPRPSVRSSTSPR